MLRPAITQLITKNESYYSLVIGVAKRARQIADELYENNEILREKPVKTAVEEFASGKYKIVESDETEEQQNQYQ
ncbi:MAG: DNA-directed RNA polymerase subunit omega [Oscillospiraceae bacterium]|nr:DNA-directed RNA polymerase subunit omega [Oscillospiraceae bacterium]